MTATNATRRNLAATTNSLLGRFTGWRIGRSNGHPALLYVVGPDYRQIVLWPPHIHTRRDR